jgi:Ni/Co efflux regulator RcnB
MRTAHSTLKRVLFLVVGSVIAAAPAFADKPEKAGKGKADKHDRHERDERHGGGQGGHFSPEQRSALHMLYGEEMRAGRCPPGLAKKRNGCMPPGQAKKWATGQRLPHDVVFYPLPPLWRDRLGPPPAGHQYIRVASDILLITIGTSMVVDAIQDLGAIK